MAGMGVAEPPPWPLGVVWPPPRAKMGVAETTPIWLGGGRPPHVAQRGGAATPTIFFFFKEPQFFFPIDVTLVV